MSRWLPWLPALVACAVSGGVAQADDVRPAAPGCEDAWPGGMPDGPVQVGVLEGELGVARRLCPRTEVGLGGNALLVADLDDFYGNVRASAVVWGSWTPGDGRTELFATFEAFRFQTVISSIDAVHLGLGHLSLGGTRTLVARDDWRLGTSARLVLPTAFGLYENAWPLALDLLAEIEWTASRLLRLHAHAGGLGSVAVSGGPADPEGALVVGGGGALRPLPWLALVAELDASFGRTDALDHLAATGALRLGAGERFGAELGATFPLAGRERALTAAVLRVTWRF